MENFEGNRRKVGGTWGRFIVEISHGGYRKEYRKRDNNIEAVGKERIIKGLQAHYSDVPKRIKDYREIHRYPW